LLNLNLPRINDYMTTAIVEALHAREGDDLAAGAKLLDLTVDLSLAAPHDCPPISHYRIVLRETAQLRRLCVRVGDEPLVGAPLAVFATEHDEAIDAEPGRRARIAIAAIMYQPSWGER
jgi:pyruvate/2-oxoglutarate dehydrogenase complex dihydrolipoamide acyltransferase (E2) component